MDTIPAEELLERVSMTTTTTMMMMMMMMMMNIIIITNLIYIARVDTNSILTARYTAI